MAAVLEGVFNRGFDLLASILTAPLAMLFLLVVTATYLGVLQSRRFRGWFISLLTQANLIEVYIDSVRSAVKKAKQTLYFHPTAATNDVKIRPRYTRFLALALAYATIWYLIAWSLGANLSVGSLDILPPERAEDRFTLLWMIGFLTIIVVIVTSQPGEFDKSTCIALGDSVGSPNKDAPDYLLFWRPFRPYKNKLGLASSVIIFLALIGTLEPWLVSWTISPHELLTFNARLVALASEPIAIGRLALCLLVAITVGVAVASIGHAFVAFTYVCAAAVALIVNLPVHIALPPMVAAAAFYRIQAPLVITIFFVPILLFALTSLFVNRAIIDLWEYKLLFSFILSLPIISYVAILEEPIIFPGWAGKLLLGLLACLPFSAALLLRDIDFTPDHAKVVFAFWLVFPAVNAAFDLVSWRSGIRNGEQLLASAEAQLGLSKLAKTGTEKQPRLDNKQMLLFALYWGGRALIRALLVVLTFAVIVPFVIILVNYLHTASGFDAVINPRTFVDAMLLDPFSSDVIWITAMLLTPLVPSALNFGIAFFLILLIPFSVLRDGIFDHSPNSTEIIEEQSTSDNSYNLLPLGLGFLAVMLADLLLFRLILLLGDILLQGAVAWVRYSFKWPSLLLDVSGLG